MKTSSQDLLPLSADTQRLTKPRAALRVSDVFVSVQGEGEHAGTKSCFIRTTGCNLRCTFCDTPYTSWSPEGHFLTREQILREIDNSGCEHVVLTGGEPLLPAEIVPLSLELQQLGHRITIETAGTIDRPVAANLMSISPKLANSDPTEDSRWRVRHQQMRHRRDVMLRLMSDYPFQLKFVIDTPADLDEVQEYLTQFPRIDAGRVWLMPQGITANSLAEKGTWLVPAAHRLGFRFCPRRHIEQFGNVRGT